MRPRPNTADLQILANRRRGKDRHTTSPGFPTKRHGPLRDSQNILAPLSHRIAIPLAPIPSLRSTASRPPLTPDTHSPCSMLATESPLLVLPIAIVLQSFPHNISSRTGDQARMALLHLLSPTATLTRVSSNLLDPGPWKRHRIRWHHSRISSESKR